MFLRIVLGKCRGFFEYVYKITQIVKTAVEGYVRDLCTRKKHFGCHLKAVGCYVFDGRFARYIAEELAEIILDHTALCGKVFKRYFFVEVLADIVKCGLYSFGLSVCRSSYS